LKCRSCGGLYFRKNTQKICLKCYTNDERREQLFYTVKEWSKLSDDIRIELSGQYEVILTNHFTTKEKLKRFFSRRSPEVRKRNKEKISKGFNKFKKLLDQFSNGMSKLHFAGGSDANMNKLTGGFNKATGVDHNFAVLTGVSGNADTKPKRKSRYRIQYGPYRYQKRKQKDSDPYSTLSGGNDRDFSL